jgi:hypothetical protein
LNGGAKELSKRNMIRCVNVCDLRSASREFSVWSLVYDFGEECAQIRYQKQKLNLDSGVWDSGIWGFELWTSDPGELRPDVAGPHQSPESKTIHGFHLYRTRCEYNLTFCDDHSGSWLFARSWWQCLPKPGFGLWIFMIS